MKRIAVLLATLAICFAMVPSAVAKGNSGPSISVTNGTLNSILVAPGSSTITVQPGNIRNIGLRATCYLGVLGVFGYYGSIPNAVVNPDGSITGTFYYYPSYWWTVNSGPAKCSVDLTSVSNGSYHVVATAIWTVTGALYVAP